MGRQGGVSSAVCAGGRESSRAKCGSSGLITPQNEPDLNQKGLITYHWLGPALHLFVSAILGTYLLCQGARALKSQRVRISYKTCQDLKPCKYIDAIAAQIVPCTYLDVVTEERELFPQIMKSNAGSSMGPSRR